MNSLISIIIPCKNEGENVQMTVDSLLENSGREKFEIIVVDDASNDFSCDFLKSSKYKKVKLVKTQGIGAARARNYGAELSKGSILVFCDAHIKVEYRWLDKLKVDLSSGFAEAVSPAIAVMGNKKQVGYGQTWDNELQIEWLLTRPEKTSYVPLLPGGCLAVLREAFIDVGGFDQGFKIWGHEDEELSLKLWLFGHSCAVSPNVTIEHIFRTRHPYKVLMYDVHYNLLRMAYSHFKEERIKKITDSLKDVSYYKKILKEITLSDTLEQRERYFKKRKYDDDWFMSHFAINF